MSFVGCALRSVTHHSYLAFYVTTVSAIITLGGVGLLYFNKIPEGSLTAGSGAIASLTSIQFAKDKKEELQDMMDKLEE